jgi:hypothetical protein
VRARIAAAAERAGRDPAEVTLVAVGKLQPVEALRAALAATKRSLERPGPAAGGDGSPAGTSEPALEPR